MSVYRYRQSYWSSSMSHLRFPYFLKWSVERWNAPSGGRRHVYDSHMWRALFNISSVQSHKWSGGGESDISIVFAKVSFYRRSLGRVKHLEWHVRPETRPIQARCPIILMFPRAWRLYENLTPAFHLSVCRVRFSSFRASGLEMGAAHLTDFNCLWVIIGELWFRCFHRAHLVLKLCDSRQRQFNFSVFLFAGQAIRRLRCTSTFQYGTFVLHFNPGALPLSELRN